MVKYEFELTDEDSEFLFDCMGYARYGLGDLMFHAINEREDKKWVDHYKKKIDYIDNLWNKMTHTKRLND